MPKQQKPNIAEKRQRKSLDRKEKLKSRKESPIKTKTLKGKIRISKSLNGFIDLPDGSSVIIPKGELATAINGDTVKIELLPKRKDKPGSAGKVIEIVKRGTTHIAGVIDCEGKTFFVKPIKSKFPFLIYIEPGKLEAATCGTAVLAKITSWQSDIPGNVKGEIVKTYGQRGQHETDMSLLIGESLPNSDFEKSLLKEVSELNDVNAEAEIKKGRRDFRGVETCTIDPERAQDFDDALSVKENPDGTWDIGIHIADVSYYVKEKGALDIESYRRGTSIYLVDRCIPMLPERLSNDLCSLREGVDRLTMSVVVTLRPDASIQDFWIGEGVINSNKRFTYDEVDKILEAKNGLMYKELSTLMDFSKKLESARIARGALVFNRDEIRFVLDKDGKPVDIVREKSSPSHTLIESFMLLANKLTAEKIEDFASGQGKKRGMYRVHAKPNETALYDLMLFAKQFGIRINGDTKKPVEIFKSIMKKASGMPIEPIMNDMIIRTQAKAHYSEINSGHFGLALNSYNHFTSPIRRYPDLVVHRIIKGLIENNSLPYESKELHDIAEHASEREEKATEAERASNRYKQIEFLEKNVGEIRKGMLVGLTEYTHKVIDQETMAMVYCKPTGVKLTLGDQVEYKLEVADRLQDELSGTITNKI